MKVWTTRDLFTHGIREVEAERRARTASAPFNLLPEECLTWNTSSGGTVYLHAGEWFENKANAIKAAREMVEEEKKRVQELLRKAHFELDKLYRLDADLLQQQD